MDENRIMDKLDRIAEDGAATRADVRNLANHLAAVSANHKNLERAFLDHKDDGSAHGLHAIQKRDRSLIEWGTLIIAVGSVIVSLVRH
jgi:hypothetical protein